MINRIDFTTRRKNPAFTAGGVVLSLFLALTSLAPAAPLQPFFSRHQSPLVQIFGLPPAEGGLLLPQGKSEIRLVGDISSSFSGGGDADERLSLDGETYRLTLAWRHGWNNLEWGIDVPYVAHDEGHFDGFINDFHEWTGLSSGARQNSRQNNLNYVYVRDGRREISVTENTSGLGDIVLSCGIPLTGGHRTKRALSLRTGLKLPTGDAERLLGSGSTDLSVRLAASDGASLARWNLTWFGQLGALYIFDSEVLEDQTRDFVGFATLGCGWQPWSWLALKAQVDAHSPSFSGSDLRELDSWATQAVFGGSFFFPAGFFCDWGLGENILVETAPDVVFHLAIGRRF